MSRRRDAAAKAEAQEALLAPPAAGGSDSDDDGDLEEEEDEYEFPVWWFFVIASINVFNWLFATPLWSIVWPKAIAGMFGYGDKAVALSLADTIGVIVGFSNPFIGSLSDRLPDRWAAKWGRRRPFVLVGSTLMGTGVWLTYVSLYLMKGSPHAVPVLLISLVMGNTGSALAMVPFGAMGGVQ